MQRSVGSVPALLNVPNSIPVASLQDVAEDTVLAGPTSGGSGPVSALAMPNAMLPINRIGIKFGAAVDYDFNPITAGYSHLLLTGLLRGAAAAAVVTGRLQINGDTGANYDWQTNIGSAAVPSSAQGLAANFGTFGAGTIPGANATAGEHFAVFMVIPLHPVANARKQILGMLGATIVTLSSTVSGTYLINWRNTDAITSIRVFESNGAGFAASSQLYLYGVV